MTATTSGDTITFSSGRTMYVNDGIVGLRPDFANAGFVIISEGYDGEICWPNADEYAPTYTEEDMLELADMMIGRWNAFRAAVTQKDTFV